MYDEETYVCTRHYDRTTTYCDSKMVEQHEIWLNCQHEELPASACCDAKKEGKKGKNLDESCTTITIGDD